SAKAVPAPARRARGAAAAATAQPERRSRRIEMAGSTPPVTTGPRPEGSQDKLKVALGCGVGATIETYDFIGFGTAAALYFGSAFFPGSDPLSATLMSFATLGVGFAARPLGGVIAGHLGDRIGRKPVL